jgi:hypothetical protein
MGIVAFIVSLVFKLQAVVVCDESKNCSQPAYCADTLFAQKLFK